MARAPLQVLVLPYRFLPGGGHEHALFRRSERSGGYWQGIAGGAEGLEKPLEAARREAAEEAGIPPDLAFFELDARTTVSADHFAGGKLWGPDVFVVPVHVFAVDLSGHAIRLSGEHSEYRWCAYGEAAALVRWDIDRTALFELHRRLVLGKIG
jgi:dATP pyrophosphohydrolase